MTQYSGKIIRKNPVVPTQVSASGVWTLDDVANATKSNTWPVAGVPNPISRSVRLRSSASAYFSRTPASAGNRKTWTWSGWIKRGTLSSNQILFGSTGGSNSQGGIRLLSTNCIDVYDFNGAADVYTVDTTSLYRDPSAWYHIVVAMDTTQATAANRVKIYVNGVQITSFSTATYPSLNLDTYVNNTTSAGLGANFPGSWSQFFDGHMTEVNFIDGQALTASSFGTTDAATGAWIPMPYTGTYGTNGFYVNFKDTTSTTTLGLDYSGNSNHWASTNISLTAGATYDSMVDVPTLWMAYNTAGDVGATVRGNYCTLNSLKTTGVAGTYSNANLTGSLSTDGTIFGTFAVSSGKWYWEITPTAATGAATTNNVIGVSKIEATVAYAGNTTDGFVYRIDGNKYTNATASAYGASWALNDNIGVALDMDAGTVTFYKNGVSQGTAFTGLSGNFAPVVANGNTTTTKTWDANFGQRPFTYTPPTGFKTLNTFNLPDATIKKGNAFFDATIYTGDGTSSKAIVNSGPMQPDMVWLKVRNTADNHSIADSVRGAPALLQPNTTAVENAAPLQGSVGSFNSNGFTIAAGATNNTNYNTNGNTYVAWQWNAGGATVSNNSGSIASQVRANPAAGVSVLTYTGTGANATVGHGLGVAPKMVIVKRRNAAASWIVWQTTFAGTDYIVLESTAAKATLAAMWNSATPTSTVINLGSNANTNGSTDTYVAYCFAEVAGFSKFGSYTGNGSTDGPFVYCGFRPKFVMCKRTDAANSWPMFDSSRAGYNSANNDLYANLTQAEATSAFIDIVSNGFKIRNGASTEINGSGATYIFMAFAEYPFKNSNAR